MLIHERSELQGKLELRGSTLAAYFVEVKCAMYRSGKKEEEVTASDIFRMYVEENDRAALTEVALMDANEKEKEMDEIKVALQALQFKPNPVIPDLSEGVIEKACKGIQFDHEDYDIHDVQSFFPSLDANTIVELMKRSDYDMRACTILLGGKQPHIIFVVNMYISYVDKPSFHFLCHCHTQ